jgi:ABC-type transporter Mla subunit MlaD
MGMVLESDRQRCVVDGGSRGDLHRLLGGDAVSQCNCTECQLRRLAEALAAQENEEKDALLQTVNELTEEVGRLREQLRELGK